jgi:hypothetical protein
MTQREKNLLRLLAGVALVAVALVGFLIGRDALAMVDRDLGALRKQYELLLERQPAEGAAPLASLDSLRARQRELEQGFFQPGETTVYRFSAEIQKRLVAAGLTVRQFAIDAPRHELSLTASGTIVSVLSFLHDIQLGPKSYDMRMFLLQRTPDDGCQIQMRLRYVEIGS